MNKMINIVLEEVNSMMEFVIDDFSQPPEYEQAVKYEDDGVVSAGSRPHTQVINRINNLLKTCSDLNDKNELGKRFLFCIDTTEDGFNAVSTELMPLDQEYEWKGFNNEKRENVKIMEDMHLLLTGDARVILANILERCSTLSKDEDCYYDDDLGIDLYNMSSLLTYLRRWRALLFIYQDVDLKWTAEVAIPDDRGYLPVVTL